MLKLSNIYCSAKLPATPSLPHAVIMVLISKPIRRYIFVTIIFLSFFLIIAVAYTHRTDTLDQKQFRTHAAIISDDIWALNQTGATNYLKLALKANHYKSLSVAIPGDESSFTISSPSLTGITQVLYNIKLIGTKNLSEDIVYKDISIGTLHGVQYVRILFPLLNILIFVLLVLLTCFFILYLQNNKKFLEKQILERTQNLRESQRRFHDLVNLLPEIVLEIDLQGKILYANKEAKSRFNIVLQQPVSMNFFDIFPEAEQELARQNFHLSLKGDHHGLQEFTAINRDGRPFPVLIRSAPIEHNDTIIGARTIAIDITERHRMEEQLNRDQKMKAIGLMAGGVAHDLNNILSGIVSYPELLLMNLPENSDLIKPLEAIRKSGIEASEVVSDLLTVARGIATKTETVGPNTLIQDYLDSPDFHQLTSKYPQITFDVSLEPTLWNIICSPIHVRKCLMNLITNGVEAIPGKGSVSISTANHLATAPQPLPTNIPSPGSYSKIIIHDSGTGIASNEIDHIFEPFYTKKVLGRSGTGLGLAVVWNIMNEHGGTICVTSNSNGTTFELYFPSVEKSIVKLKEKEDWQAFKGHGETALVVDDDPRQRDIATKLLTSLEYSAKSVSSGEEAVEFLKTSSVDIVILDMLMPPGQNGRQTFDQILQIHPQQKAVIASGYAEDDDVQATLEMGAGAFIAKPYTLIQLGSAVHRTLFS